jgi:hypothetical protein
MQSKFGTFVLASAVMAAAAFSTIPAQAATSGATTVNVPFSFTVHGKSLPAGEYRVQWDGASNFVTLSNRDAVQSFVWYPSETATVDNRVTMKFVEDGQGQALQAIQYGALTTPKLVRKTNRNEDVSPRIVGAE